MSQATEENPKILPPTTKSHVEVSQKESLPLILTCDRFYAAGYKDQTEADTDLAQWWAGCKSPAMKSRIDYARARFASGDKIVDLNGGAVKAARL